MELSVNGVEFKPLPLALVHRSALRRVVRSAIASVPGGIQGCMSAYDSDQAPVWDIPRKILEPFRGVSLHLAAAPNSGKDLENHWRKSLDHFVKYGFSPSLSNSLEKKFGEIVHNPLCFDRSSRDPYKFAIDYAILTSNCQDYTFFAAGDTIYVDLGGELHSIVGMYGGQVVGVTEPMPEDLLSSLWDTRGQVISHKFDIYDRIRLWASANYTCMDDVDGFVDAVTLLKLSDSSDEALNFERKLHATQGLAYEKKKLNVPDTLIDTMRDAWLTSVNSSPEKAFHDVFVMFVPNYFDSEVFKRYFGVLPQQDKKLTPKQIERIDEGVHKLAVDLVAERGL